MISPEKFAQISSFSPTVQRKIFEEIGRVEFERCSDSPVYWLDASLHPQSPQFPDGIPYVFTKDPHLLFECRECDMEVLPHKRGLHLTEAHNLSVTRLKEIEAHFRELPAVRPFPQLLLKAYMLPLIEEWVKAQYFVVEKSRDMMATWLMVALHTWDALFHKGRQHIFQSQTAPKSLELIQRSYFIAKSHPKFLRDQIGQLEYGKGDHRSGELFIRKQESEIFGFAQGPDQIRQFHPTGVFQDEAAFQIEAEAAFAAIKPAILMGGKFSAISSANRSWFEKICRDTSDN